MSDFKPRQVQLVRDEFPRDGWASSLVNLFNQLAQDVVQAFGFIVPQYRELSFKTASDPIFVSTFPIDFPVSATPADVWVADSGDAGTSRSAMTVKWKSVVANGRLFVRVTYLTGLSFNTQYVVRLGYR